MTEQRVIREVCVDRWRFREGEHVRIAVRGELVGLSAEQLVAGERAGAVRVYNRTAALQRSLSASFSRAANGIELVEEQQLAAAAPPPRSAQTADRSGISTSLAPRPAAHRSIVVPR